MVLALPEPLHSYTQEVDRLTDLHTGLSSAEVQSSWDLTRNSQAFGSDPIAIRLSCV
jgi:hypothetical protein